MGAKALPVRRYPKSGFVDYPRADTDAWLDTCSMRLAHQRDEDIGRHRTTRIRCVTPAMYLDNWADVITLKEEVWR